MKRFSLIAVAALAAVSVMSIPSSAAKPAVNQLCEVLVSAGHFDTMGKCMSRFKSGPAKTCRRLKDMGLITKPPVLPPPFDFTNVGECVSFFKKN